MPQVFEGKAEGKGLKAAVAVSRFNEFITKRLVEGAISCLKEHGVADGDIAVYWVPGAYELPALAERLARAKKHDLLVMLGCVIRGGTSHYDHVCNEAMRGLAEVARNHPVALATGLVTTENVEQAVERAGGKLGNKGSEAAMAALEMYNLYKAAGLDRA